MSTTTFQPQVGVNIVLIAALILMYTKWLENTDNKLLSIGIPILLTAVTFFRTEVTIIIGGLYGTALFIVKKQSKKHIFYSGFLFIGILLLISSINWISTNKFRLPLPTFSGHLLYQGNNPHVIDYVTKYNQSLYIESYYSDHPVTDYIANESDPVKVDRLKKGLALSFIRSQPKEFIKITCLKFLRYWDYRLDDADKESFWKNMSYSIPYLTYIFSASIGLLIMLKQKKYKPLMVIVPTFTIHSIFMSFIITSIRYRMIFEFLLIILASWTITIFLKKEKIRRLFRFSKNF